MTMLLAHPEAEDLGRFVEGTLDDPERTAIVDHIADCDDCRVQVVDAAEFIEPAVAQPRRNWWMGVAASLMLVVAIGTVTYYQRRDRLAPVEEAYGRLPDRPLQSRLSGFPYVRYAPKRGGGDGEETDTSVTNLQSAAAQVLGRKGNSTKIEHDKGVSQLLFAATDKGANNIDIQSERSEAIAKLEAAARSDPKNADYENDLAVALLSTGDPSQRDLAIKHLDNALLINPRFPEALFNRALALSDRNPKAAIAAFHRYLAVDSSSPWATEAKKNIENLQDGL